MNLNIVHGIATLISALGEAIIGSLNSIKANSIFLVFLAFIVISLLAILWRFFLQYQRRQEEAEFASDDSY